MASFIVFSLLPCFRTLSLALSSNRPRLLGGAYFDGAGNYGEGKKGAGISQREKVKIHPDLFAAQKSVYEPSGLVCSGFIQEVESQEYGACSFEMDGKQILFRVAKITPTKIGQFVTLWKRIGKGPIQPYDLADHIDFFVVSVRMADRFGQFVFPKAVLVERDVVSQNGKGGKRAMRVYPPWDVADSPQAKRSQAWQLPYFYEIKLNEPLDGNRMRVLFQ